MFLRFFLFFFLSLIFSLNLYANQKQLIIDQLLEINNFTFSFEQITQGKLEVGTCFLVFDNKLKCKYINEEQKEIIVNEKTLVIIKKKYNKTYFYPISESPFLKILNKNNLIELLKESYLELNDNIDLVYTDENMRKIIIFFDKKNYQLVGWKIKDKLQNEIYFSLKIQSINIETENNFFKIPSNN